MVTEVRPQQTSPAGFNAGIDRAIAMLCIRQIDLYIGGRSPVAVELEMAIQELKNAKIK